MRKPDKIDDGVVRLVTAQTVQNFIDDPYYLWDNECSVDGIENLKKYFRENGIPFPNIPDDNRREGALKSIYLVWAALECNNCICALMGCEP
jgi:hypothetical protein